VEKHRFRFLKPEDIKKLANFEFAPKYIVEGYFAGRHQAKHQGVSSEFRDYRPYTYGDDTSALDWKVFARTEKYFIRTFEQETNTACYILLDSSASMGFGDKLTKLEYASFFSAALCYLITRSGNQAALETFDTSIREYLPPGSTGKHLQNLMHILEKNTPGSKTSLSSALIKSFPLFERKGSIVIISDFFDNPAEIFSALNPYLHRGFKVYLFHILTPEEIDLQAGGMRLFIDMEDNSKIPLHTDSIKNIYRKEITKHIEALRELSKRREVEYTFADTSTHYFQLFDKLIR
jgi:uncharacterized protein (DUF58 family)